MTHSTNPEPLVFEMREEELAYRMLFSNLDADQRAVYAESVRHGGLPPREGVADAG